MTAEIQNAAALRFETARRAEPCVKWLRAQGLSVLSVQPGLLRATPRVIIHPSPLCDRFEGAVSAYERSRKGEWRYKMVFRFDCQITWPEVAA